MQFSDIAIIMVMDKNFVKTTVYLPRVLYEEAKLMAIFTHSNVSHMVRISLSEKIKQLKERHAANLSKKNT